MLVKPELLIVVENVSPTIEIAKDRRSRALLSKVGKYDDVARLHNMKGLIEVTILCKSKIFFYRRDEGY